MKDNEKPLAEFFPRDFNSFTLEDIIELTREFVLPEKVKPVKKPAVAQRKLANKTNKQLIKEAKNQKDLATI